MSHCHCHLLCMTLSSQQQRQSGSVPFSDFCLCMVSFANAEQHTLQLSVLFTREAYCIKIFVTEVDFTKGLS